MSLEISSGTDELKIYYLTKSDTLWIYIIEIINELKKQFGEENE